MSDKWIRDTGLVCALVSLVFAYRGSMLAIFIAGAFVIAVLLVPSLLSPLAWVWLKITELLNKIMQPLFFGLVFFLILTPIGVLRRLFVDDKRDLTLDTRATAFVPGVGRVTPKHLERPY